MKFFSANQLLVTRHASVKTECFATFFIDKNVYFILNFTLRLSYSNHFMGSFIYSLFPRLISSRSCKPHRKFQLSSLLTLFLEQLTSVRKINCIPLKNDTEISDKVTHTPDLATLTTLRHHDRVRKTLTLTAYDGEMVTKFLPR